MHIKCLFIKACHLQEINKKIIIFVLLLCGSEHFRRTPLDGKTKLTKLVRFILNFKIKCSARTDRTGKGERETEADREWCSE